MKKPWIDKDEANKQINILYIMVGKTFFYFQRSGKQKV